MSRLRSSTCKHCKEDISNGAEVSTLSWTCQDLCDLRERYPCTGNLIPKDKHHRIISWLCGISAIYGTCVSTHARVKILNFIIDDFL